MVTNAVAWLRDYLAARDLSSEVASGLAVERFDVDHLSAKPMVLERLPAPLPQSVRRVAETSLVVFGAWCAVGALYVVLGALAVVLMPILMGREGVGTAMITLFTVSVTAVLSGIQLLAARSAARVTRREKRGVRSLYIFSVFAVIGLTVALGIVWWIKVAFFGSDASGDALGYAWTATSIVLVGFIVWFARAAFVLRNFARHLRNGDATS